MATASHARHRVLSIALVAAFTALTAAPAEAACTGCAKPGFGPSARPFPAGVAGVAGDFNGDGRLDVATIERGDQLYGFDASVVVSVCAPGGGMTETFRTSPTLVTSIEIASGDFDRDGKIDLVVLRTDVADPDAGGIAFFYRGDGAGRLGAPVQIAAGMSRPLLVADIDGDGRADLVLGNGLLRGNGDGTFQLIRPFPASGCGVIAVGDFDVDGKIDLLVSSCDGRASVFLNRGSLSFERVFDLDDWGLAHAVRVGDVDGDGVPDIVVGGESGVGVLYGLGGGAFLPAVWEFGERTFSLELGDLNRDGRMDVIAGALDAVALVSDEFGFLQPTTRLMDSFGSTLVGDFDGDGFADVASPSSGTLYLGNGDGTFVQPRFLPTGYATNLTILDLNKDGKADLAWMIPNSGFGTMLGDGAGGFSAASVTPYAISYFDSVVFADVTNDGIPDVVALSTVYLTQTLFVFPGDGSGRFGTPISTALGFVQTSQPLGVADFDADGHVDVALIRDGQLLVLLGDGTGHFPATKPPLPIPWGLLKVADLNGDGKPDLVLVVTNGDSGGTISTLLNNGTGAFRLGSSVSFDFLTASLLVLDADGDGKPDLLSSWSDTVSFRKGDGAGAFGPAVDTHAPGAWRLVAADFDGDGVLDLFAGLVLKGLGDGTFEITGRYPLPAQLAAAGDVTGDGKPDVLGTFNGVTTLLSNTTCLPRRLFLDPWPPSCGAAGAPFATQPTLRLVDDAGNPLACETGAVNASIVAGTAGASLGGTTTAPLMAGVAAFTNLSIDRPGGGYVVRFDLPGARGTATPRFSQSLPAPSISGPTQMCSGSAARFEGPAADAWTWTLDGSVVGSSKALTLFTVPVGSHALALTIRTGECTSNSSRSLTVSSPLPALVATSNSAVPFGGTLQLNASTVPGASYRWTGPNAFASLLQNPAIPLAKESDSGRYTVVATVGTCASAPASTDAVVMPPPCSGCPRPSFAPAVGALPVPAGSQSVALADVDNDGSMDILATQNDTINTHGTLAFFKGDGRGGFAAPVISAASFAAGPELQVADLDGNGLLDAVGGGGGLFVSLQTAPGRFGTAAYFPIGAVSALALADVDNDGTLDIVVAQTGGGGFGVPYEPGHVGVLLGNGAGGFGAPTYFSVELGPSALLVRDLNGDGKPDLVVANQISETVSVFFGDGAGGFTPQATLSVAGPPVVLAMGDVTGDGIADLVVGTTNPTPAAVIFQGAASGALTFVRSLPVVMDSHLLLADLNGDGRPELVTLASGTVRVWLGQGAADFAAPVSYAAGGDSKSTLAVGDVNGDGRPDVVVGAGARVLLLAGDGNGGLPSAPSLNTVGGVFGVKALDMNADGRTDLVVSQGLSYPSEVDVYLAGPNGHEVTAVLRPPSPRGLDGFATGDVDGDGIPDVIVIDRQGYVLVFQGLGKGLFAGPVETSLGHPVTFLAAGDVDGDGRIDLLFGPSYPYNGTSVVFGNPASGFGSAVELPSQIWNTTALIADLSGDGKGDVVARDDNSQALLVYLWSGTSFGAAIKTPIDAMPNSLAVGDFDGDGKKDLVVGISPQYAGTSPGLRFLSGDGAGHFAAPVSFGTNDVFSNLVVSDFNGDGALDVAATSNGGTVAVYAGDGHGAFPYSAEYGGAGNGRGLAAADLDGDGKADLAFSRTAPSGVAILYNTNCVPSRLGVIANPACALAGQPFSLDVGVFDDGGNVVSCGAGDVGARLVAGTGTTGAVLSGTASVTVASGLAHFGDLAVDRDGRRYRIELSHPLAVGARTAPFSVGAVPSPSITGPPQLCAGTSVWTAPSGYDTYAWTIDGALFSSARRVTPAFLSAGNHTLGLTATRDRCPAQANVVISNAPPALTALSPNHGVSQGGTFVTLTAGCVAPGASVAFGGVVADPWVSPEQPPLQVITRGHAPGAVDAVVTNPDGQAGALAGGYTYECDAQAPAVSNNGPICAGSTLRLGAPYFAGATYAWTGPNGFTANTRFVNFQAATPAHSGAYTVTVGNVFGCTLPPASTTAVVKPIPSAAITAPSSVTPGSIGNVASVPDAGPGASYTWTISSGNGTITTSNDQRSITFDAGASGGIDLNVYVSSAGCPAYSTVTIPITPRPTALQVVTPCRLVDTRLPNGPGGGPALAAGVVRNFPLAGRCGVPADATAIAVNVTATLPSSAGALRVYPGGTPTPGTTNLSFGSGQTRAGSSIVGLGPDGSVDVVSTQSAGTVHVILDVSGYFK